MKRKSFPTRRLPAAFLVLIGLIVHCVQVKADLVVLTPAKETTILSERPSNGNGAGSFFFSGKIRTGGIRRALIAFDFSTIPGGATIDNVSLTIRISRGHGSVPISLHKLETDWGEGGSMGPSREGRGASATQGDATWMQNFFNASSWNNPGGDFLAAPSATIMVGNTGDATWSTSEMIGDIQSWVDQSSENFGWIILGDESTSQTAKRFSAAANPPSLSVAFTPPSPPTHREQWVSQHFPSDPENAADALDLDGDGLPNLLEYAFDFDPRGFNAGTLPDPVVRSLNVSGSTADFLTLQFIRIPAAADLTYTVESSGDLANWTVLYESVKGAEPVNSDHVVSETGTATRTVTVRATLSVSAASKRFLRLCIVRETPQGK